MKRVSKGAIAIAAALAQAAPAYAAVIAFSGTATATASVGVNAACPVFRGIASGSGTSSYGAFTYSHVACTTGATGPVNGTYIINFGIDQFSGNFGGTSAATATAGLFDLLFTYNITDGTGRFAGGTGSFNQVGTVSTLGGPPSHLSLNFSAVPEPATWALMLIGFAGIGLTVRRRGTPELRPA
jgi:hypothetical protein